MKKFSLHPKQKLTNMRVVREPSKDWDKTFPRFHFVSCGGSNVFVFFFLWSFFSVCFSFQVISGTLSFDVEVCSVIQILRVVKELKVIESLASFVQV